MSEAQDTKFDFIVDLIEHMCDELVDEPESVEINHSFSGTTGSIEICGPSSEIGKIMGSKKRNFNALQTIVYSVASKYGFRVALNVLNNEQKARFLGESRSTSGATNVQQNGSLLAGG